MKVQFNPFFLFIVGFGHFLNNHNGARFYNIVVNVTVLLHGAPYNNGNAVFYGLRRFFAVLFCVKNFNGVRTCVICDVKIDNVARAVFGGFRFKAENIAPHGNIAVFKLDFFYRLRFAFDFAAQNNFRAVICKRQIVKFEPGFFARFFPLKIYRVNSRLLHFNIFGRVKLNGFRAVAYKFNGGSV